jgi:hypothetical protein
MGLLKRRNTDNPAATLEREISDLHKDASRFRRACNPPKPSWRRCSMLDATCSQMAISMATARRLPI